MGLYGDLPQAKGSAAQEDNAALTKQNSWTPSNLAPPARKPSVFGAPPAVLRAGRGKPTSATQRQSAVRRESGDHTSTSAPTPTGAAQSFFSVNVQDEYDPARPNDYEEIRRTRERQRVDAEREAERQEELRAQKAAQEAAAKAVLAMQQKPPDNPAAAAASMQPPGQDREAALGLSGEEAFARRAMLSRGGSAGFGDAAAAAPPDQVAQVAQAMAQNPGARGMDLAAKMMEKMGWKSGLGLGRNKQGIVNPLMVQKTDKRGGSIVSSPAAQAQAPEAAPPAKKPKGGVILGTPTRVVLLRNMVGPGEVDPDLEDEVANECSKYGQVQSVMIFEVTTAGYPDDQAVRIFVEFERMEQATKVRWALRLHKPSSTVPFLSRALPCPSAAATDTVFTQLMKCTCGNVCEAALQLWSNCDVALGSLPTCMQFCGVHELLLHVCAMATQVRDHIGKFWHKTALKSLSVYTHSVCYMLFSGIMLISQNAGCCLAYDAHALACYCSLSLILEAGSLGAEQCLQLFSMKISLTSRTWVQNQESLHDHMVTCDAVHSSLHDRPWAVDVVTVMHKFIASNSRKTDRVG